MARKKLLTEGEIRQFMKLANLRPAGKQRLSEMGYPAQRDDDMGDEMPMDDEGPPGEGEEDVEMDMDMEMDAAPDEGGGGMVSMDDFMSALERAIEEVTGEEADVSEEPGAEDMDMEAGDEEGMGMDMDMGDEEEPMMEEREAEARRKKREKMKQQEKEEEKAKDKGKKGFAESKAGDLDRSDIANQVPKGFVNEEEEEDLQERKPHMGARSDDPGAYKKGKFGAPDPEPEDSYAGGEGAGKGEKPERYKGSKGRRGSGGQAAGFGRMSEEAIVNEVAKRVAARLQSQNQKEQMVDRLAERIMKRLTK
jgi:hypothetical protein